MNDDRCVDWQTQRQKLNERGKYLLGSGLWSDCKFVVGLEPNERVFSTHKIIMSMASPVFEAMFFGGLPEQKNPIPVPDVQPQAFLAMLEYIYGDEVNLHSIDQACELCYVAKKYMIPFLVNQCTAYIWRDVDATSACRAYEFAKLFDEHGLMNKCLQIIAQNTSAVLHGSSFTDIELSTLLTILDLEEMNISSEKELIHAVHRWAHQACIHQGLRSDCKENLRSVIGTVIGKIRFLTLSPSEFAANSTIQMLLSQSEAYALLMKISAPNAVNTIPDGFSSNNTQRYLGSNQDNKLLYCERNLVQQINIQNLSQSDSCVVFMVNQDIWFHGIQVPTQVVTDSVIYSRLHIESQSNNKLYAESINVEVSDNYGCSLSNIHFTKYVPYKHVIDIKFNKPVQLLRNTEYKLTVCLNKHGYYPLGVYSKRTSSCGNVIFTFCVGDASETFRDYIVRTVIFTNYRNNPLNDL